MKSIILLIFIFIVSTGLISCSSSSSNETNSELSSLTGTWRGSIGKYTTGSNKSITGGYTVGSHKSIVAYLTQNNNTITGYAIDDNTKYNVTGTQTGYSINFTMKSSDGITSINWQASLSPNYVDLEGDYTNTSTQALDGKMHLYKVSSSTTNSGLGNTYLFEEQFNTDSKYPENSVSTQDDGDVVWVHDQGLFSYQYMLGIGRDHNSQKFLILDRNLNSDSPNYIMLYNQAGGIIRTYSKTFYAVDQRICPFDNTIAIIHAQETSSSQIMIYKIDLTSDSITPYTNSAKPNWQTYDPDLKLIAFIYHNDSSSQYEIRTLDANDLNATPKVVASFPYSTYKNQPKSLNIQPGSTGNITYTVWKNNYTEIHHLNIRTGIDIIVTKYSTNSDITMNTSYTLDGKITYYTGSYVYEVPLVENGQPIEKFKYPWMANSNSRQFFYSW